MYQTSVRSTCLYLYKTASTCQNIYNLRGKSTKIYEILMFLMAKFNGDPKVSNQHEVLSSVVTVLLKGATSN
ncbi:hypothetical protein NQ315_015220 [Exocentrus adspersus]|uniref:Uncharacterized protein n=1 Tax=Exocentrus adspersus TaxID=1586481 RepID=A0AAV8VX22_9CUCU|nr:hypothetical protein NQ315_015220 [Exocentrus adspersus]